MSSTSKIQYIMSLSPSDRLIVAMMFVIVFESTGWSVTSYNFGQYRNEKENQISDIVKANAIAIIATNNAIMEKQNRRYELMDSTANAAKAKVNEINDFLKNKK